MLIDREGSKSVRQSLNMEYDSSVSMLLPDSIDIIENDFDTEDIVHEQTKQNEVKNLIRLLCASFCLHIICIRLLN